MNTCLFSLSSFRLVGPDVPAGRLTEEQPPEGTGFIITGAVLPDDEASHLQH